MKHQKPLTAKDVLDEWEKSDKLMKEALNGVQKMIDDYHAPKEHKKECAMKYYTGMSTDMSACTCTPNDQHLEGEVIKEFLKPSPQEEGWDVENEINAILPILKCELTLDGKMNRIREIVRSQIARAYEKGKDEVRSQRTRELNEEYLAGKAQARQETAKACVEMINESTIDPSNPRSSFNEVVEELKKIQ